MDSSPSEQDSQATSSVIHNFQMSPPKGAHKEKRKLDEDKEEELAGRINKKERTGLTKKSTTGPQKVGSATTA